MQSVIKHTRRIQSIGLPSTFSSRILYLENNVYKVTYYEIITGATGTLTVPTGATINSGEFSGANCILSEIDGSNKPTWVSPKDAGGTVVTSTLNTGTGAWVKSGTTVSANVALIYSVNIAASNYQNLNNSFIIDETVLGDLTYVLNNTTNNSVTSALLLSKMSDETGSGALVFGTSPTFTTDITTPKIIGNGAVTGLTIQTSTTASGAIARGTYHTPTLVASANNDVLVGLDINPTYTNGAYTGVKNYHIRAGTTFYVGQGIDAYSAFSNLWMDQATPDNTNFVLRKLGASIIYNAPSGGNINFGNGGTSYGSLSNTSWAFSNPAVGSGAYTAFTFNPAANTNQTLSTNIPNFKVTGNTKQWATGALATQYFNYFSANTVSFVGASTATDVYGMFVEAPIAGTNATVTNALGFGTNGMVNIGNKATTSQRLVRIGQDTAWVDIGSMAGSTARSAIYFNVATPDGTNWSFSNNTVSTAMNAQNTSGNLVFSIGTANRYVITNRTNTWSPGVSTSGAENNFIFITSANTNQTASTNIPNFQVTGANKQWATGALANQYWNYLSANTASFVGASTLTNSYGLYVEAATAGTNATITNNYAAGFNGRVSQEGLGSSTFFGSGCGVADDLTTNLNTAFGNNALLTNITGTKNCAFGYFALRLATGSFNVAFGTEALQATTTGAQNVAIGNNSLYSNQTGTGNTAVGDLSLYQTTGGSNTGLGKNALYDLVGGTLNTVIGWNTGRGITTGGSNTIIGSQVTGLSSSLANNVIIADGAGNKVLWFNSSNALISDLKIDTTTGIKIGTATSQKLAFWNATPIVQPTTADAAGTLVSNGGTTLTSTDTIDGYTLLQVVKALRNTGLLA